MSVYTLNLPKDKGALASLIRKHADREEQRIMPKRTMWLLAWYYFNGYRRFDQFDPLTGWIHPHLLDEHGNLEFQSMELLSALDRVVARLNELDVMPFIRGADSSLSRIRERSIAQILLDSVVSEQQVNSHSKRIFNFMLAAYGSAGIQGHLSEHPTIGLSGDLEPIHPREIFSWPSIGQDLSKQQGIVRQRMIPISTLQDIFGAPNTMNPLYPPSSYYICFGDMMATEMESDSQPRVTYSGRNGSGTSSTDPDKETVGVAKIREVWIDGPRGTCSRYIISCGEAVITDEDLSRKETYCPVGWARFMESGTFHGLGMFDLLYGINRQMEFLLKQVFNNVLANDRFGTLVLPVGTYNERAVTRDKGTGMQIISIATDQLGGEAPTPFHIAPINQGDSPMKTVMAAKSLMQGINPIQDLSAEKGRVDSASGLQYLDEQINKAMTNPSAGVEIAFSRCYQSLCSRVARQVMQSPRPIPVGKLTLDLAGAVINPEDNSVSFPDNPLPDASRLIFSIKESNPKSKSARKAEAVELFKIKPDPDGLTILALREGLDFAMYTGEEQSAFETIQRNCLLVYGDGQTPGQAIFTEYTPRPDFQMRILNEFMGHPRMALASIEVQDAFSDFREALTMLASGALPEGVPNPDEMATAGPQGPPSGPPGMPPGMASRMMPPQMAGQMAGR